MSFALSQPKDMLVLEISSSALRWAYFSGRKTGLPDVKFTETLLEGQSLLALKTRFPARPAKTVLVIKRDELLTKTLKLPSGHPQELARIVAFTLPQELPYDISEIVYRFDILNTNPEGFSEIRVMWMLKKNIEEKLRILETLGLNADEIISSDQALLFYYLKLRETHTGLPIKETFLNLEPEESEIIVIDGQKILFSYRMKNGLQKLSADPAEFVRGFKGSLEDFKKQARETTSTIAFTAVSETMLQLRENFEKLLEAPVKILPALGSIDPLKARTVPAVFLGAYFYESFNPAGLLPADLKKLRQDSASRETLRAAARYTGAFMALTLAGLYCQFLSQSAEKGKLSQEYSKMHFSTKQILHVAEGMEFLAKIEKEKSVPLDFLGSIPGIVPAQISLTQIEYDHEQGFRLRGIGENNQSITALMKALKAIPRVKSAEFDFSRRKIQDGKEYFEFQISSKINPPGPENA